VDWVDFLLWQTVSNQQYVIDRVRRKAELVSLNHPSSRGAYDVDAMRSLTGYQLIEIVNGPFAAEDVWDAALSSGRPVWAVANDDTHDLTDVRRTAVGWNMIDAATPSTGDVVAALRAGRFYAVLRTGALDAAHVTTLNGLTVTRETLRVMLRGSPSTVTFIGQDGIVRGSVKDTRSAEYRLTDDDTYIRAVVTSPQTTLYLNPVIRWDGRALPRPAASVNVASTWLQRGAALAAIVGLVLLRRLRRTETAVPARTPIARRA
jgi:hypothetical protein